MKCDCRVCKDGRNFKLMLERLFSEEDKQFWQDAVNHIANLESDRDYYKALVEGSWPNADEVITKFRNKE